MAIPNNAAIKSTTCVGGASVRQQELGEIAGRRRQEKFGMPDADPAQIPNNLVGLALSGGGVRSGAFSLGVLQALYRWRILPYVDYLSTVSGGGYAGAYLSSVALKSSQNGHQSDDGNADGDADPDDPMFPIAAGRNDQHRSRMMQFIYGGRYLRKTWVFFNRYLMGLLLIWLVVVSALIAATSFMAWAFRSLDHVWSRAWLSALGFDDDVSLAFFPSFVLLVLWLVLWGISYFKFGARATGTVARYVHYALLIVTLVAIAAIIGNGEVSITSFSGPASKDQSISSMQRTVGYVIVTAICAALLPYLSPKRLIRSGSSPANTAERYTFWIATRALVYGVPFVLVAIFARENISDWYGRRDSRLAALEIKKWDLSSPLWRQVRDTVKSNPDDSPKDSVLELGNIWRPGVEEDRQNMTVVGKLLKEHERQRIAGQEQQLDGSSLDEMREHDSVPPAPQGAHRGSLIEQKIEPYYDASRPASDARLGFVERWWHLLKYLGQAAFQNSAEESKNSRIYRMADQYYQNRHAEWEIARLVNERLVQPDFFETFLPESAGLQEGSSSATEASIAAGASDSGPAAASSSNAKGSGAPSAAAPIAAAPSADYGHNHPSVRQAFEMVARSQPSEEQDPEKARKAWWATLLALRAEAQLLRDAPSIEDSDSTATDSGKLSENEAFVRKKETQVQVLDVNRRMLKAFYGDLIEDKGTIYSGVALVEDQKTRLRIFVASLAIFLIAGLVVDLNATSWHGFYSEQVGNAWIEEVPGLKRQVPLTQLETTAVGRPYHLISATLQLLGKRDLQQFVAQEDFLFSKLFCGSDRLCYAHSSDYMGGNYSLGDAIAVSGAAVSPTQTNNPLLMALLTLANVRLGQWVANPAFQRRGPKWYQSLCNCWPVTPLRVVVNMFRIAENRPSCFVTDGGQYENLGVEPLLQRRCRLIIASDASQDGSYDFADLNRLIRRARAKYGIVFRPPSGGDEPLRLDPLIPSSAGQTPGYELGKLLSDYPSSSWSYRHFLVLKIEYPPNSQGKPTEGYLIYMKSSMTGDESIELRHFKKSNPSFPHDSTADQFYDPDRFESYRELGYHITDRICKRLGPNFAESGDRPTFDEVIRRLVGIETAGNAADQVQADMPDDLDLDVVNRLLDDFESGSPAEHKRAINELKELGPRALSAAPRLLTIWWDAVRKHDVFLPIPVRDIFLSDPGVAMPIVMNLVATETKPNVRAAAVAFLPELTKQEEDDLQSVVDALKPAARDKHAAVRYQAVKMLGERAIDRPDVQDLLAEVAEKDPIKRIRELARKYLRPT